METQFILDEKTYYLPERPHISVSQIKDYLKDPSFYFRRYVLRDPEVAFQTTDPIQRGSVVDDLLTRGETSIEPKVTKKDDPDAYERQKGMDERMLIGRTYWDQALQIVRDVKRHPVWRDGMQEAKYQTVLHGNLAGLSVCGLADRIDVADDINGSSSERILDLKVVSAVKLDSARKWLWNVIDFGYDCQMAMYRHLRSEMTGVPKERIECAHVVAAYVEPGLTKVRAYKLPPSMLDAAESKILVALRGIAAKDFSERLVTWDDAEVLPFGVRNDDEDDDDLP